LDRVTTKPEEQVVNCNLCGRAATDFWTWVCESADARAAPSLRGKRRFPVMRCLKCGLAYISPRYTNEQLYRIYSDESLFTGSTDPEGRQRSYLREIENKQRDFVDVSRWLERYVKGGELLEIGCGPGFFLDVLGPHWHSCGIDLSPFAVEYARGEMGLEVIQGEFGPGLYESERFDAVLMLQVLDHLPDPRQALLEAGRLLKTGGVLMLTSLINGKSYCARVFSGGYRLLAPNHLYYFSPSALRRLLAETGFCVEEMRFPYWGTPYCNYGEINNLIVRSAQVGLARLTGREPRVLSPPFYGNHIDLVARKLP
jgi:SAM-dependent methyltransferase